MERSERFAGIQRLLRRQSGVGLSELRARLEVSRATIFRDLAYLRDRLGVPWVLDTGSHCYRLDRSAERSELPGLWFSAAEVHALLTMRQLLARLDPAGLLGPHLDPLQERLAQLLESGPHPAEDIARRIRILTAAARRYVPEHFQVVAGALMERRRLVVDYAGRSRPGVTRREVSPQRLTHYRDNWYLDAWCHLRDELRSFSVDAMHSAKALPDEAVEISEATLGVTLDSGYGIFSGPATRSATLCFTPTRARWVAAERWHAAQDGCFLEDGRYQLTVPYSDDPELVMDILKYGPDCQVLAPADLREKVRQLLQAAAARYGDD